MFQHSFQSAADVLMEAWYYTPQLMLADLVFYHLYLRRVLVGE